MRTPRNAPFLLIALSLAAACAPLAPPAPPAPIAGLPPVPRVDGALAIRVVHPTPATPRPNVDSTFIYGSVGTGAARLTINGTPVEVYPNGAFLAFLATPADGRWNLVAEAGAARQETAVQYRMPAAAPAVPAPAPAAARAPTVEVLAQPTLGRVITGSDTLSTGSDVAIGRPTPGGAYRWFLPRGTQLVVTARRGDQLRAQLAAGTEAWVEAQAVELGAPAPAAPRALGAVAVTPAAEWVDVRIPAQNAPFLVQPEANGLAVTVYNATPPATPLAAGDALIAAASWSAPAADAARLQLQLSQPLWGFRAFFDADGTLVVRLRRPPRIDERRPLQGVRIVIDPGHPPAGATGPTGLTEAEANLAISLPLAAMLRERGATVHLTRTENVAVSLAERVNLADAVDAHLLVSVHNNAFPEGVNPFRRQGTSTYFFHAHAGPLARALQREIQATTLIPDLGALTGNLALVRPTWMPTTLTESLFMAIPEQEAALRDPGFTRRLAEAHVRGIERFLQSPF